MHMLTFSNQRATCWSPLQEQLRAEVCTFRVTAGSIAGGSAEDLKAGFCFILLFKIYLFERDRESEISFLLVYIPYTHVVDSGEVPDLVSTHLQPQLLCSFEE